MPIRPLEAAAIALLLEVMEERRVSRRALAEKAGIPRTRTASIFSGEVSCSVSDFADFCSALGLLASSVVRDAEARLALAPTADAADDDGDDDDGVVVTGRFPAAPPPPPAAEKAAARGAKDRPEWEAMHQWDDVGEETQVRDDEDEGE